MATFLLVHGACVGGSDWDKVRALLEGAGHTVLAPDLPGMGKSTVPLRNVNLKTWGHFIADIMRAQSEPVVLVGHSRGGIVISQAAEFAPDHVQVLVYAAAMLVPSGSTQGETSNLLPRDISFIRYSEDGASIIPDNERAFLVAFNRTDPKVAREALLHFCPEPADCFNWPVETTEGNYGRIPRVYIEALHDKAIPLQLQRMMQQQLPCDHVVTLDSDHSLSHCVPDIFAEQLARVADMHFDPR